MIQISFYSRSEEVTWSQWAKMKILAWLMFLFHGYRREFPSWLFQFLEAACIPWNMTFFPFSKSEMKSWVFLTLLHWGIVNILKISKSRTENHLHKIVYVNCFDVSVLHKLREKKPS